MAKSVLLFGATGPSGLRTLEEALQRGYKVTAIARSPEKLSDYKHENLTVVAGDAFDKSTFIEAMRGKDAVLSCLGSKMVLLYGTVDTYSSSIKQIHEAMVETGVQRGIFMSSWGSVLNEEVPFFYKMKFTIVRPAMADMARMEDYLQESGQDINFTVVRAARLNNEPQTKFPILVKDGSYFINGVDANLPRADVGRFFIDCLETSEYDRKMIAIALDRSGQS